MLKRTLLATAIAFSAASIAAAQPEGLWDHNGSAMQLSYNGPNNFGVYYQQVRPGLIQTIPPGSPRFEGQQNGNQLFGNAFVYTKYCPGARFPYQVSGIVHSEGVIELYGPAAVVDPYSCSVVGYAADSDNAHIVFHLVQPLVVALPAVVAPSSPVVVNTPVTINNPPPSVIVVNPPVAPAVNGNGHSAIDLPQGRVERREELKRQGREFCEQYPADEVCNHDVK